MLRPIGWSALVLLLPVVGARGETFRTPDEQELTFIFKPGEQKARYLHGDLPTAVREARDNRHR